ncbi:hypothetical protein [Runella sp.]|uniref:hypothetical protein n=1 Tax=Runella sp. TaxID=1960881 RepID=UPI003D10BF6F
METNNAPVTQSANVEAAITNFLETMSKTMPKEEATVALDHLTAFMSENPQMFRKLFSENTIGKIKSLSGKKKKPSMMDMASLAMEIAGDFM